MKKRFYAEGQINYLPSAQKLYYTRDHLGSIREVTDTSRNVQARYDYDPYGRVTKVSGSLASDFLYTGHYYHAPTGLHLALYRAYDADLGRWLNRDPIGERGGLNLYGYVLGDPINKTDPDGHLAKLIIGGLAIVVVVGFVIAVYNFYTDVDEISKSPPVNEIKLDEDGFPIDDGQAMSKSGQQTICKIRDTTSDAGKNIIGMPTSGGPAGAPASKEDAAADIITRIINAISDFFSSSKKSEDAPKPEEPAK